MIDIDDPLSGIRFAVWFMIGILTGIAILISILRA